MPALQSGEVLTPHANCSNIPLSQMPEKPASPLLTLWCSCCAGGGQKLCPEAKLDDGLLDVTFVQNVPPRRVPELMQVVLAGKRQDDLQECVKTFKTPWFEVRHQPFLCSVAGLHVRQHQAWQPLRHPQFALYDRAHHSWARLHSGSW